jgi:hypothetical protein
MKLWSKEIFLSGSITGIKFPMLPGLFGSSFERRPFNAFYIALLIHFRDGSNWNKVPASLTTKEIGDFYQKDYKKFSG